MTVWYNRFSFHPAYQTVIHPATLHTGLSFTQNNKYQVSHRYSYFSWWWAHSSPEHAEKRNKHTKKNCAPSWLYVQENWFFFYCVV